MTYSRDFIHKAVRKIPEQRRDLAVAWLREHIEEEQRAIIRTAILEDPVHWWVKHHWSGGIAVRNTLRSGGFSEDYLEVFNLDDVWQGLLELAVKDEG
jgi:hypothetical protein